MVLKDEAACFLDQEELRAAPKSASVTSNLALDTSIVKVLEPNLAMIFFDRADRPGTLGLRDGLAGMMDFLGIRTDLEDPFE